MRRLRRAGGRSRRLALATTLAAAVASAAAATALAVVNGAPDGGAHPYVGLVGDHVTDELCSGSFVSPTLFVTAAHCVGEGDPVVVDTAENGFADLTGAGADVVTGVAHPDPAWTTGKGLAHFDRNDVAVVVLDAPVSLPRYAELPAQGLDGTLPKGARAQIVGYGLSNPSDGSSFGARLDGSVAVVPGGGATGADFLKLSSSPGRGSAVCSGDSGGPVLLPGTDTVLAIASYGPNAGCKAVSYAQRLDTPQVLGFLGEYGG